MLPYQMCIRDRYHYILRQRLGKLLVVVAALHSAIAATHHHKLADVALKLKEIFGASDINELPIFFNIAWYEQKAVIVLLALSLIHISSGRREQRDYQLYLPCSRHHQQP